MHHQYFDLDTIQAISSVKNRAVYNAAVALTVAYVLPLPSLPVESPIGYFDENFKEVAANIAGVFTEVRPVSITETVEDARHLWNARYAIAHGAVVPQITAGSGQNPTILTLFGISYNLPSSTVNFLSENAAEIEPIFAKLLAAAVRTNMVTGVQTQNA